ncbi:MAG: hypothetical protein VXW65_11040 [Pseudomonadota bacterium]|nr:hypothetical protein [Pseudomonadota bacterium]
MLMIGDLSKIAFEIGAVEPNALLRDVKIYIAGQNICPTDSRVYLPTFRHGLSAEISRLKTTLCFKNNENCTAHLSIEERFDTIFFNQGCESANANRLMQWSETTDDVMVLLLDAAEQLYLAAKLYAKPERFLVVQIWPYELIRLCEQLLSVLDSPNAFASTAGCNYCRLL